MDCAFLVGNVWLMHLQGSWQFKGSWSMDCACLVEIAGLMDLPLKDSWIMDCACLVEIVGLMDLQNSLSFDGHLDHGLLLLFRQRRVD